MKEDLLASTSTFAISPDFSGATPMKSSLPLTLENILADMWRAFDAQLYYPALLVGLTLPEVCAALRLEKSEFVKKPHYVEFIETFAPAEKVKMSGLYCYQLRGGTVHRANAAGHAYFDRSHVIFTVPETGSKLHGFTLEIESSTGAESKTALMIDLGTFLEGIEDAVRRWYEIHGRETLVRDAARSLICWRPEGLSPFVEGAPVVSSGPS